jgi:hypothetical protein
MQVSGVPDNVLFAQGDTMKPSLKPITSRLYKAWLRSRLDNYNRSLTAIAAQRENDFHAERMLHRAVSNTRSKLQSL